MAEFLTELPVEFLFQIDIGTSDPPPRLIDAASLFQTGHPDYAWLNPVQAVALGTPGERGIVYDVYQVL